VVEARVLGELERRLQAYAVRHGGHYPWLADAAHRDHGTRLAAPGNYSGKLAFHYFDSTTAASGDDAAFREIVSRHESFVEEGAV